MKTFFAKVLIHSIYFLTFASIIFIVLFDVDGGVAIGTAMFNPTPLAVIATAEILGNLLWLFSLVFWIGGVVLFVISLFDNIVDKAIKEAHTAGNLADFGKLTFYGALTMYTNLAIGIFAVGSGFWFSGTGIILMILGVMFWRKTLVTARDGKLEKLRTEHSELLNEVKSTLKDL